MANSMTVETIGIRKSEVLMLFWHKKNREWWATVGPLDMASIREGADGATPTEAMAELMIKIGGRIEGAN